MMSSEIIPVTKPYLPSKDKYKQYVDRCTRVVG